MRAGEIGKLKTELEGQRAANARLDKRVAYLERKMEEIMVDKWASKKQEEKAANDAFAKEMAKRRTGR